MAEFTPHLRKRVSKWSIFNKQYGGNEAFVAKPGEHLFLDFAEEHKEQAAKEKGIADYASFDKEHDHHAIVAVGTTGTGKSSIVQLFCGGEVGVSHDTHSQTKRAELFDEVGDDAIPHRKWMDTQGTDDSDMDDTDDKILKRIFKKLWAKKIHFITILWLISGDFDRQKGEYLRQAQFIGSLQTENSVANVWDSVLMIQKMGTLQPKWNKIRGIVDSAKKNGAQMVFLDADSVKDHIVGFKCIELIALKGDDPMYEALVDAETPQEKLVQLGYVTKTEMKSILIERMKKINCFMLDYQDKICEKCSLRGDPRYLYYKCHFKPKPHHPKPLIPYHPKALEEYHPLETHVIHPQGIVHIHPKDLEEYHPEDMIEMEVDDTANPIFDHPGEYITIITGKLCCTKESQKWNCCQKEAKYAKGCRKQYPKKTVLQYPCCKKRKDKETDIEEKSCDETFHGGCSQRYLCCQKKKDSEPCVSKYQCCDQPPRSEGCSTVWKCCDEAEAHKGCKERYQCCEMPEDARGCEDKWECCDQAPDEKGCDTVCERCDVRWGHRPGCSWPEVDDDAKGYHDESDESEDMQTNDYDEAHNPTLSTEFAQKHTQIAPDIDDTEENEAGKRELSPIPSMGSMGVMKSTEELL
eukprot:228179_1